MRSRPGRALVLALALASGVGASRGHAAEGLDAVMRPSEYEIKAAFVYGVLKFVTWPEGDSRGQPLAVGVLGPTAAVDMEKVLGPKQLRGRRIVVRSYARARDLDGVDVLFVAADAAGELRDALDAVKGQRVLTIAEADGDLLPPPVISLSVAAAKLVFTVNLDVADGQGLQLSSNLLALARRVDGRAKRSAS